MKYLSVHKNTLLLIASFVWFVAGANIARIGVDAYSAGHLSLVNVALSTAVALVFWTFVFGKLVVKHTDRITGYEEDRHFFLKFFDVPAFIIMAVMMTGGITIRAFDLAPEVFIAVFYTGLGSALALAGLRFACMWLREVRAAKRAAGQWH